MKWFYITSVALTIILAAAPFVMLRREDTSSLVGKVVSYDTYGSKVKSIDPATCGDTTSASVQGNIYESLYGYHYLKRPVEVVPVLADGMPEVSQDKLSYTIRIKKGVKYHRNPCFGTQADGTPRTRTVKAEDFVLAFKRIADYHIKTTLALSFIRDQIAGIEEYNAATKIYPKGDFSRYDLPLSGVRALDDHTLQITLTEPFPRLLYVLAINNYAPFPREVIDYHLATRPSPGGREPIPRDQRDPEIREPEAAVGTGPYYLSKWIKASRIVQERNPDYRREEYPGEGEPGDRQAGLLTDAGKEVPFTDVRFRTYVPEDNPMWMLFLTRQSDTAGIPIEIYHQVINPDKELTDAWKKQGIQLVKYKRPMVYWYAFNMKDKVLGSSKSLRQAMCLAYNVEEFIELLRNGRAIRPMTYIPSTFEGHAQAHSPYAKFDLDLAGRKLEDARKELIEAGVMAPGEEFPEITLSMGGREEILRKMGEFAMRQFKQIGLKIKIELNDWPTLQEKVHNKTVQMYSMGWHADYPDPENFLQLYYSPNIKTLTNNTNYSNPEFDALYERASVMEPSADRTKLYVEMLKILNEDCPALLNSEPIGFALVHPWLHNYKPHPIGYGFGKFIRLDTDLRASMGGR